ncbi:MAG: hypothetical protein EOO85_06525 [Pedobacter sp.]|nr:MAG: hypothetical protein EOO85_06525 [Pedobacter sp.]
MKADEFEAAFYGIDLPESVQLDQGVFISNVKEFLAKELRILKNNPLERTAEPVQFRLNRLLEIINQTNETS